MKKSCKPRTQATDGREACLRGSMYGTSGLRHFGLHRSTYAYRAKEADAWGWSTTIIQQRSQGKRCNQAAEPPALFGGLRYHHNYRRAEKEFDEVLTHKPVQYSTDCLTVRSFNIDERSAPIGRVAGPVTLESPGPADCKIANASRNPRILLFSNIPEQRQRTDSF